MRCGTDVIMDRYVATALTRGLVRGMPVEVLTPLWSLFPLPDLTFVLELGAAQALVRRRQAGASLQDYLSGSDFLHAHSEQEAFLAYHAMLQRAYGAAIWRGQVHYVDASGAEETVLRRVANLLRRKGIDLAAQDSELGV